MRVSSSIIFSCDAAEYSGVKKIAGKVCLDVERVTGGRPGLFEDGTFSSSGAVLFATLGKSPL
ncbi:MAG: hypothetical protein IJR93_14340, partial [Treponema sp.]|nr:hypothetical protein [Treponema sp.]